MGMIFLRQHFYAFHYTACKLKADTLSFIHIIQKTGCRKSEGVLYFPLIFMLHLCDLILFIYFSLDETVFTFTAPSSQVDSAVQKSLLCISNGQIEGREITRGRES